MTLRNLCIVGFIGLLSLVRASDQANRRLGQHQGLRHRTFNKPEENSIDDEEKVLWERLTQEVGSMAPTGSTLPPVATSAPVPAPVATSAPVPITSAPIVKVTTPPVPAPVIPAATSAPIVAPVVPVTDAPVAAPTTDAPVPEVTEGPISSPATYSPVSLAPVTVTVSPVMASPGPTASFSVNNAPVIVTVSPVMASPGPTASFSLENAPTQGSPNEETDAPVTDAPVAAPPTDAPVDCPARVRTTCETIDDNIPCHLLEVPEDKTSPDCLVSVKYSYNMTNLGTETRRIYSLSVVRNNELIIVTNFAEVAPVVLLESGEFYIARSPEPLEFDICTEKGTDIFDATVDITGGEPITSEVRNFHWIHCGFTCVLKRQITNHPPQQKQSKL